MRRQGAAGRPPFACCGGVNNQKGERVSKVRELHCWVVFWAKALGSLPVLLLPMSKIPSTVQKELLGAVGKGGISLDTKSNGMLKQKTTRIKRHKRAMLDARIKLQIRPIRRNSSTLLYGLNASLSTWVLLHPKKPSLLMSKSAHSQPK